MSRNETKALQKPVQLFDFFPKSLVFISFVTSAPLFQYIFYSISLILFSLEDGERRKVVWEETILL